MRRGLVLAVLALLVAAAPAQAVDIPLAANCDNLDAQFAVAQADTNEANHYIITLDSSAKLGGLCHQAYTLPNFPTPTANYRFFTLKAATPGVDGFDGTGLLTRMLTGVNVHRLTLQDLVFRNGNVSGPDPDGGALKLTGQSSLGMFGSTFLNNTATEKGGAVYIAPDAPTVMGATLPGVSINGNTFGSQMESNHAAEGGALAVDFRGQQGSSYRNNTFTNNVASQRGGAFTWVLHPSSAGSDFSLSDNVVVGNKTSGSGGGGHVIHHGVLRVDNERYEGNSIDPIVGTPSFNDHYGGGLYIEHAGQSIQRNNRFRLNEIKTIAAGEHYGGAGLAMFDSDANLRVDSQFSRFESNKLPDAPAGGSSEGGGLFLESSQAPLVQLPRHLRG